MGHFGRVLQAAAGQILYLALHLESGSFPRPLSPAAERAAFAALRTGGVAGRDARDQLVRHNLRLVAHVCKKYYAATSNQDDLISIGTIGLIKAVDTFDPVRASKFASYASRCIENELRMELRKIRREGAAVSLQEPLESGSGQLTLADTLPDDTVMEDDCERRADATRLRRLVDTLPARERRCCSCATAWAGASGYPAADCRQAGHQPQLCFPVGETRPDSVDERLAPMNEKSM
ncbi:MAG: sigma-70 family RNA polymerase sigma factor [Subdoligranulum sp.]|nr:sigma-70 family RNA polymerase sigma factor [Subdoligranulum sp.]